MIDAWNSSYAFKASQKHKFKSQQLQNIENQHYEKNRK